MTFKFGQTVRITKEGFYLGTPGVIIGYDEVDNTYQVLLPFSRVVFLYACDMIKTKKKVVIK